MATLILGWICGFHDPLENGEGILSALRNGSFAIVEPSTPREFLFSQTQTETLRILMFSALAVSWSGLDPFLALILHCQSHLVSIANAILVTLLAYRAAAQWLRASEHPDDVNLTPIQ